jgi:hypothetical protein
MATSRSVGNYSTSAKAVIRASDQIFDAAMSGKPDFTKISKEAIKGRSMERRAVTQAEGEVASAGLAAYTKAKRTQNAADTAKEINDIKRPARRMAGMVAGLGAISGAALMHKNLKEDRAERAELRALDQQNFDTKMGLIESEQADTREMIERMKSLNNTSLPSTSSLPKTNGSEPTNSGSTPATVSTNISAQHSAGPGKLSREKITSLATDAGFTPEQANTVYGIAGGESGFDPTNSTARSGLKASTGEDSVGLMQINWGYHKDKGWLQGLGINSREDLFDPAKNMKAAKYLHDGRGNFGDWTVFNKGIYKDYL